MPLLWYTQNKEDIHNSVHISIFFPTYTPSYPQYVDNFIQGMFKTNIWNIPDFILI